MVVLRQYDHYSLLYLFLQDNGTALHDAAEVGNNNAITYLIDHGAGVNDVTNVSYHYYYSTTSFSREVMFPFWYVFILVWEVIFS